MSRKKLSEMTPFERVESRMKGMTWDEAEEAGIEILARVLALHVYARKEDENYLMSVVNRMMERASKRADEWAHTKFGARYLALASVGYELQQLQHDNDTAN